MELIEQQGETCIIASLAMVWGCTFAEVVEELGHDGTALEFPDSAFPGRGIHAQEVMDIAYRRGYAMTIIQLFPVHGPADGKGSRLAWKEADCLLRLKMYLCSHNSVLIGRNDMGNTHAVAWDGLQVYDPAKGIYSIADFTIKSIWQFHLISQSNQIPEK